MHFQGLPESHPYFYVTKKQRTPLLASTSAWQNKSEIRPMFSLEKRKQLDKLKQQRSLVERKEVLEQNKLTNHLPKLDIATCNQSQGNTKPSLSDRVSQLHVQQSLSPSSFEQHGLKPIQIKASLNTNINFSKRVHPKKNESIPAKMPSPRQSPFKVPLQPPKKKVFRKLDSILQLTGSLNRQEFQAKIQNNRNKLGRNSRQSKWENAMGLGMSPVRQRLVKSDTLSVQGTKNENQDRAVSCLSVDHRHHLFAVLDGHGKHGHLVSEYLSSMLVSPDLQQLWTKMQPGQEKLGLNVLIKRLENGLLKNQNIPSAFSGSTLALLLIDYKQGLMFTANVGDSRVVRVAVEEKGEGRVGVQELTIDHKPNELLERVRIIKAGGEIMGDRVYLKNQRVPGLNMSRSIGDQVAHQVGVSSHPDVSVFRFRKGQYVLLGTDGLFEFQEDYDFVVDSLGDGTSLGERHAAISRRAASRWEQHTNNQQRDDITSILLYFQWMVRLDFGRCLWWPWCTQQDGVI